MVVEHECGVKLMKNDMTHLKLGDVTVLSFNLDESIYDVVHPELLPFLIRDSIIDTNNCMGIRDSMHNYQILMNFFSSRSLNVKRENAKKILNVLNLSQRDDYDTKLKIMVLCKALSMTDNYWITNDKDERWETVDLRNNHLNEAISQIALLGKSLTVTGNVRTPELTGQGIYAKAWFREGKELYLYKASTEYGRESEVEVAVSDILDRTNISHVKYEGISKDGRFCCKCKNIAMEDMSLVPAEDVISWCTRTNRSFNSLVKRIGSEDFYKMVVLDYLISNPDRHSQNWGFYMDNKTGELKGMHPLFDHNNAFDKGDMSNEDGGPSLVLQGKTKREAARHAIKYCDLRISSIDNSVFVTGEQCASFTRRARELGLIEQSKELRESRSFK